MALTLLPKDSITKKLNLVITTTSLLSLLMAGAAFMIYDWVSFRSTLSRELMSLANLVGYNSMALLEFKDARAGKETLTFLKANPHIVSAALYDENGKLFVEYQRNPAQPVPFPASPRLEGDYFEGGYAHLYKDIENAGNKLGTISLRSDLKELETRFQRYTSIVLSILLASGILAYLLSLRLQKEISKPILDLAETSRKVSDSKDYSLRGKKTDEDEVGFLVDRFNDMLAQIQDREEAVQGAQDALEHRVEERTRDLQNEIDVRKHLQGELVQAKEEAEKANRAKSEFLSKMSHELRTPLNAILGFGQILDGYSDNKLNPAQTECVDHILKSGHHLLKLINEILDLSRIELGRINLDLQSVEVGPLVSEVVILLNQISIQKEVELINEVPLEMDLCLRADPVRLKQVLLNLGSNAIKYNHAGGTVRIRFIDAGERKGRIEVIDTGPGIDPKNLSHIFEPFNRLGAERTDVEGTGIGLTITKNLLELMNGTLEMDSTPGKGSCFALELPIAEKEVERFDIPSQEVETVEPSPDLSRPRKILYIEDNPFNLKLVESVLSRQRNMEFLSARNAELGLDMARAHRPDLILMDINLPGMSGLAAFQELKKQEETKHIPIIAVSADALDQNIQKALDSGFHAYVTKPLNIQNFISVLNQVFHKAEENSPS